MDRLSQFHWSRINCISLLETSIRVSFCSTDFYAASPPAARTIHINIHIFIFTYLFLLLFLSFVSFFFLLFPAARSWCQRCSHCLIHGQPTQSKGGDASHYIAGRRLSTGYRITELGYTKGWLSVHLRHELVQIFEFRLRFIAENFNIAQSEYTP